MIVKLLAGGIISCIPAVILELLIGSFFPEEADMNFIQLFFYVFIGIALVEELCKWVVTYKVSYNSKYFDCLYDMILYATFVSLGFALFGILLMFPLKNYLLDS